MAIKMVEDLGAPAVVTLVDIVTLEVAPTWNEWASYLMAVGGYVSGFMGFGGPFVKNIGIASLDWAARNLYQRVKGVPAAARVGSRKVAFTPARPPVQRSYQPEFESVAPHAF